MKDWITIKVPVAVREHARGLAFRLLHVGWKALGADRSDAPGIGTVIEEALKRLEVDLDRKRRR